MYIKARETFGQPPKIQPADISVYLLDKPPDSASFIFDLMTEHGIPKMVNNQDITRWHRNAIALGMGL